MPSTESLSPSLMKTCTPGATLGSISGGSHSTNRHARCLLYLIYLCLSFFLALAALKALDFYPSEATEHAIVLDGSFDWTSVKPDTELKWQDCGPGRECARLQVPLDYSDPSGEKATVALKRVKAKVSPQSKKYRGPVLINPGGPGGSGVNFVDRIGEELQTIIGKEYDIVGFDPRGIGLTTPKVSIFNDRYERAYWDSGAPPMINTTSTSLREAYARSKLAGELAAARTKHAAQYVGTATVARDMLAITRAHGRERLLYWGFSYGTLLGATYASMFPDNIERLVIDGVVEFDDYYTGRWYSNLWDTDKILQWFYDECAASGTECPLHANSSALVQKRVEGVLASINANPLPVIDGHDYGIVDYSKLKRALFISLYQPFPLLSEYASVLAALEKGDGRPALALLNVEQPKCNSPPSVSIPIQEAGIAVFCGEGLGAGRDLLDIVRHMKELRELSVFADVWTETTRIHCTGWDIQVRERHAGPFNTTTSFPLLVIGNTGDPVTPLRGAKMAADGFKNATLLTINTPGHCSLAGTSPSALKHIRRYFQEGVLPPKGTVCEIEDKLFGGKQRKSEAMSQEDHQWLEMARLLSAKWHASRQGYFL